MSQMTESMKDIREDSLTCPLCLELFDTNLESFIQAQARRTQRTIARWPLLSAETRLPVSCTSCWYTFCNACLHRLMYRPGGLKCPICPHTDMTVADPPVNVPLVRLLRSIRPVILSSEAWRHARDECSANTPDEASRVKAATSKTKKAKAATKAKKTKSKTLKKYETESTQRAKMAETASDQTQEPDHSNSNTATYYQVHSIVGVRTYCRQKQYRVRWLGFSAEHDTWEHWKFLQHLDIEFRQQMEQLDANAKKRNKR